MSDKSPSGTLSALTLGCLAALYRSIPLSESDSSPSSLNSEDPDKRSPLLRFVRRKGSDESRFSTTADDELALKLEGLPAAIGSAGTDATPTPA